MATSSVDRDYERGRVVSTPHTSPEAWRGKERLAPRLRAPAARRGCRCRRGGGGQTPRSTIRMTLDVEVGPSARGGAMSNIPITAPSPEAASGTVVDSATPRRGSRRSLIGIVALSGIVGLVLMVITLRPWRDSQVWWWGERGDVVGAVAWMSGRRS
jgi:hypothetical protein